MAKWFEPMPGSLRNVFLGKTCFYHSASLHPGVYMGTGELTARVNPAMDWHPIQEREVLLRSILCDSYQHS